MIQPVSDLIPPPHLSASSISTFQQCPLRYKYSRIDELPEPPTEASLMGNFVHDILENLYKAEASTRTLATARMLAANIWTEYEERASRVARTPEAIRRFRWNSWWCVEKLFSMEDPTQREFDGLEHEINHDVNGVRVKGFIDRWHLVDDAIVIGDYKTGKTPKPHYAGDKFFQLLLYGVVLQEQLSKPIDSVELLYIKDGERLHKSPTSEDIQNVYDTVLEVRTNIEDRCATGEFEYKPSRLCDWCSFKSICPYWRKK